VSTTVCAFLAAALPIELIELLEKVVIEPSPLSENQNIQNLLLLMAIRADKGKVVGYINKLNNYDAGEIARIATEHGIYEEAFTMYRKYEGSRCSRGTCSLRSIAVWNTQQRLANRSSEAQFDGLRIKDSISLCLRNTG
jgi:clathrin heavy chain